MTVRPAKLSVLVAEDDPALRRLLELLLGSEGYDVRVVEDGLDALDAVVDRLPDIVICDVMMPRMSGLTFCRELRARSEASHVPVVLLTARVFDEDIEDVMRLGGITFMNKPFDRFALRTAIDDAVQGPEELPEPHLGWLRSPRPTVHPSKPAAG